MQMTLSGMLYIIRCQKSLEKHQQFTFLPLLCAYYQRGRHKANGGQLEDNRNSTIYYGLTVCQELYEVLYNVLPSVEVISV